MVRDIIFIVMGYLGGSVLFARLWGRWLIKSDVTETAPDANPGTANAFKYGGFLCGALTLMGDIGKGFLPVFLYTREETSLALALVMAAPVIGHAFPLFYGFRGGKGIAATFGSLLGLWPDMTPAIILAVLFIFFSVALRISPNYYRTLAAYIGTEIAVFFLSGNPCVWVGFSLIFAAVGFRMLTSKEQKAPMEVKLLWMH